MYKAILKKSINFEEVSFQVWAKANNETECFHFSELHEAVRGAESLKKLGVKIDRLIVFYWPKDENESIKKDYFKGFEIEALIQSHNDFQNECKNK